MIKDKHSQKEDERTTSLIEKFENRTEQKIILSDMVDLFKQEQRIRLTRQLQDVDWKSKVIGYSCVERMYSLCKIRLVDRIVVNVLFHWDYHILVDRGHYSIYHQIFCQLMH
jgi:hypothetical protein